METDYPKQWKVKLGEGFLLPWATVGGAQVKILQL